MAKSKILKELANKEISITVALNRLLIILYDLNAEELMTWVELELNGYGKDDVVPQYRRLISMDIDYSGINGKFQVTNVPLPYGALDVSDYELISEVKVKEPISNVELNTAQASSMARDISHYASKVYKKTSNGRTGIQCISITQKLQSSQFAEIINKVSLMLIKIFMKLDKEFGNLDDLDIDTTDAKKVGEVTQVINQIVFYDNSIKVGDHNKIDKSKINTGDSNGN